jgi:hypothetical protein
MREIAIDTRELPSPEPMQKVIERLGELDETTYLMMRHRMEPTLLFPILEKNGFAYSKRSRSEEIILYIYRKNAPALQSYIGSLS